MFCYPISDYVMRMLLREFAFCLFFNLLPRVRVTVVSVARSAGQGQRGLRERDCLFLNCITHAYSRK